MTIAGTPPPACVVPPPERAGAPSSPRHQVEVGALAVIHADKGLGIYLPNQKRMMLDGITVRILGERFDRFHGNAARELLFRPEPWDFWDGAWPSGWWGSEKYFEAVCP
jgi:hypothetical protein